MWFVVILLIVAALVMLFFVWKMSRGRSLPAAVRQRLMEAFRQLEQIPDVHRRVMEAEKIIDHALITLGFQGTFGEKLKKAGPRFADVDAVWRAHKLRNRIAHEQGVLVTPTDADTAVAAFRKGVSDL